MHGIVSMLPEPYDQEVRLVWKDLEENCGLNGVLVTPYPHFSWQIAENYDLERLGDELASLAAATPPFTVRTAGLGLFTGPSPVIFIRVVKSSPLVAFHQALWQLARPASAGMHPYYSPDLWIPHITLAFDDVNASNIGPVIERLAFRTFSWEFQVKQVSLIYELSGEPAVLQYIYHLGEESSFVEKGFL